MNRIQRKLIRIYLPVTLVIVILDIVLDAEQLLWMVKYLAVFSLFLWTLFLPKKTRDQTRLGLSLFFVAAGDAFLYLPLALGYSQSSFIPYGMMMFILAYGCLILVYSQGLHLGRFETLVAIPCLAVFYLGLTMLWRAGSGPVISLTLVFWGILCTVLWMALCALSKRSPYQAYGKVIALSAVLMVVCDAGVGMGIFFSAPSTMVYSFAKRIIWLAYIPAWMLIAWLAAEEHPLMMGRARKLARGDEDKGTDMRDPSPENITDRKF